MDNFFCGKQECSMSSFADSEFVSSSLRENSERSCDEAHIVCNASCRRTLHVRPPGLTKGSKDVRESIRVAVASANAQAGAAIVEAIKRADTAAKIRAATAIASINTRADAAIAEANRRAEIAERSLAQIYNEEHGK